MSDAGKTGPLDLSSLQSAVQALGHTLDITASHEFKRVDQHWRDALISGVVQHFEFTFELCWKTIKRQLEQKLASPTILDSLSYCGLIRLSHERGLIENVPIWLRWLVSSAAPRQIET